MGVSVNETRRDIMMANAAVSPKLFQNIPTSPCMKATGRNMTTKERVVAKTASAISFVPWIAASTGPLPSSSMCLKMFSRTMMASSMTMPVHTDRASSVMLLSVKPMYRMMVKVPMMDAGMATAAISAVLQFLMNTSIMRLASIEPSIRCSSTWLTAFLMNLDWSMTTCISMSWGRTAFISSNFSLILSMTSTVFVPDCFLTRTETALLPSSLDMVRGSSWVSSTAATSFTRTGAPLRSAMMRFSKSETFSMRPMVRRPCSPFSQVILPPGTSTFCLFMASLIWAIDMP